MTVLLGNLRRAVQLLQGQSKQSRLREKLLAWREWAGRRRHLARSVASRLQGRYLGGVWHTWRQHVQYAKMSRSQAMTAMGYFTAKTTAQVTQHGLMQHAFGTGTGAAQVHPACLLSISCSCRLCDHHAVT